MMVNKNIEIAITMVEVVAPPISSHVSFQALENKIRLYSFDLESQCRQIPNKIE